MSTMISLIFCKNIAVLKTLCVSDAEYMKLNELELPTPITLLYYLVYQKITRKSHTYKK